MKRRDRRAAADPEQPLSAGRVEYLEAARRRVRTRKLRQTAAIVIVLTLIIAFATGLVGESIALAKDLVDSAVIAIAPNAGWPQNTGIDQAGQIEPLSGAFVVLGDESCAVYSYTGSRLSSVQSGYARPAIAAGKTRYVLYSRSGNELLVQSRTQNLYTKTTDNSIYLCAVADDGKLAVVTDDVHSAAKLIVYSSSMEQLLDWELTSSQGIPLRLAFSPDSRSLAAAAVTAGAGQMVTNIYLLPVGSGEPALLGTQNGTPQLMRWFSGSELLVVYDNCAVIYGSGGGVCASCDFGGRSLVSVSADKNSGVALLFSSGQACEAAVLDKSLNVLYSGDVPAAHSIVRGAGVFYLLTENTIECFEETGGYSWGQSVDVRPQALLADKKRLLAFCGNTVLEVQEPESSG